MSEHPTKASIKPFGLRLTPEVKAAIDEIAKKNRRSLNAEITVAIERHVHEEAKK